MSIKVVLVCLILTISFTQPVTNSATPKTTSNTYTISQLNQYLNDIASNPILTAQLIIQIQKVAKSSTQTSTSSPSSTPSTTSSNLPNMAVTVSSSQQISSQLTNPITTTQKTQKITYSAPLNTASTMTTPQNTVSNSNIFVPISIPLVSGSVSIANPNTYIWPQTDYNCKTYNYYHICIQCYTGFYVNPQNLICTATNPLCKDVSPINICLSCYAGYNLVNGNCLMNPDYHNQVDFNCKYAINNICQQCYPGSFLNISINFCQRANPKCKNITQINTCSACYDGHILVNQDCIIFSPFADANCAAYFEGICTICVTRYYLAWNGVCVMVDPFCQNYTSQGKCLLCYIGYQLSNGNCVLLDYNTTATNPSDAPIQCPFRSLPRPGTCLQVSDKCQTWNSVTALCLTCYLGYVVNMMGECVIRN